MTIEENTPTEISEEISEEQLQEIKDLIVFPKISKIEFKGQIIPLRSMPISWAKKARVVMAPIQKQLEILFKDAPEMEYAGDGVEEDLALIDGVFAAFKLIMEFYGIKFTDKQGEEIKDLEDEVNVSEILPIVEAQLGRQKEDDFLFRGWRAIFIMLRASEMYTDLLQDEMAIANQQKNSED